MTAPTVDKSRHAIQPSRLNALRLLVDSGADMATKQQQHRWRQKLRAKGVRQLTVMVPEQAREAVKALAKAVNEGEDVRAAMRRLGGDQPTPEQPVASLPEQEPGKPDPDKPATKPKLRYEWKTGP
jgi:hypothetical protein